MNKTRLVGVALIAVGVAACAVQYIAFPGYSNDSWKATLALGMAAAVVWCVKPLNRAAERAWARLNQRAAPTIAGFLCVFALCAAYLWLNAVTHQRDMTPKFHDENSYYIQAHMLARGRVWMPPLPDGLADFFESFHLLVRPVYASIYFPGTALLYVPSVWLHAPMWVTTILITAAAGAVLYVVTSQLLGGAFGILSAVMLVATPRVRWSSASVFSHPPAMLAGLLIVWTWMRFRQAPRRPGHALALGASLGWASIVRPFDLLAYAIPVAIALVLQLCHESRAATARAVCLMLAAAAPFVTLQLILDHGTTGRWFTTPYQAYIDQFQPGSRLGFLRAAATDQPQTVLPQKLDLYNRWIRPQIESHRLQSLWSVVTDHARWLCFGVLPGVLLLACVPLGLLAARRDVRRLIVVVAPLLFFGLYLLNPFFVQHYPIVVAPAVIMIALFGIDELTRALRTSRAAMTLQFVPVLGCIAVTLAALPEVRMDFNPEPEGVAGIEGINRNLSNYVQAPAVVLFTYRAGDNFHLEPVYNYDVAWPLDAPVIRAHDLGAHRNAAIIDYFARHEPKRTFYRFDRATMRLARLGNAAEWSSSESQPALRPTSVPNR